MKNSWQCAVSPREYALLHKYMASRSSAPSEIHKVEGIDKTVLGYTNNDLTSNEGKQKIATHDDYHMKAIRHAVRVFIGAWLGFRGYEVVRRGMNLKKPIQTAVSHASSNLRSALSAATILLLYRFLFRILANLQRFLRNLEAECSYGDEADILTDLLKSRYLPPVGASLAGLALHICPSQQIRASVAIYGVLYALECWWNLFEKEGIIWGTVNGIKRSRPSWLGSWIALPFAFGQMSHSMFFDSDCCPKAFSDFTIRNTTGYLHSRPSAYPASLHWPRGHEVLASIGQLYRRHWPAGTCSNFSVTDTPLLSPIIATSLPLISRANPNINSLSCAILHPSHPSCLRAYVSCWLGSFLSIARFYVTIYAPMAALRNARSFRSFCFRDLGHVILRVIRSSILATGAIATSWGSICFFQKHLPQRILHTHRFFIGGFIGGLWALAERKQGRNIFLYSARLSMSSLWQVGVKKQWWKAVEGGDVLLSIITLAMIGAASERDSESIREGSIKKLVSWIGDK